MKEDKLFEGAWNEAKPTMAGDDDLETWNNRREPPFVPSTHLQSEIFKKISEECIHSFPILSNKQLHHIAIPY
jgi:hypothetical protein